MSTTPRGTCPKCGWTGPTIHHEAPAPPLAESIRRNADDLDGRLTEVRNALTMAGIPNVIKFPPPAGTALTQTQRISILAGERNQALLDLGKALAVLREIAEFKPIAETDSDGNPYSDDVKTAYNFAIALARKIALDAIGILDASNVRRSLDA